MSLKSSPPLTSLLSRQPPLTAAAMAQARLKRMSMLASPPMTSSGSSSKFSQLSPEVLNFFPHSRMLGGVRKVGRIPNLPIPKRAVARKGLRYEREVQKSVGNWARRVELPLIAQCGIEDGSGQLHIPDLWVRGSTHILLVETKLTFTTSGLDQLYRYAPLVASLERKPVILLQICMNLTPQAGFNRLVKTLDEALVAETEGPFVLHMMFPKEANL